MGYIKIRWMLKKKTVSNDLLKKIIQNYKFTTLDKGLKETYTWFVKNYDICRK